MTSPAVLPMTFAPTMPQPRVAVFRALMLGDLLCATPALRALRQGWPDAHVTLVGLPWARALAERLASVDDFVEFPGWPGLPERPEPDAAARHAFIDSMRRRRFDLALQMHGSGGIVNPLVADFGAARCAGYAAPGTWVPPADAASFTAWPEGGTEVEKMLALTDHLGLPRRGLQLDFPLTDDDRGAADALLRPLHGRPFAVVHAGSQLPSRRWPVERFAAVADALCAAGLAVVLTGSEGERASTRSLAAAMRSPASALLDLAGATTLWTLGAVVERAAVVVCNDTGVSHVAAALARPSVVVASGSDVARWAPADAARHRVFWADTPCRPCGYPVCPYPGHPCASGVAADEIVAAALQAIGRPAKTGCAPLGQDTAPLAARAAPLPSSPPASAAPTPLAPPPMAAALAGPA